MRIRISHPALVDELLAFFRRKGYDVAHEGDGLVWLHQRRATPVPEAAGMELELYLRVWEALFPNAAAVRVD